MKPGFKWMEKRVVRILLAILIPALTLWIGMKIGATGDGQSDQVHQHSETKEDKTVWTCSMHPQVKLPEPGQCPICFMDLIPLSTGSSDDDASDAVRLTMSENAKILAGISTAPAVRRGLSADIRLTGKVSFDETRMEMITARVGGRIDRLYVDYTGVPVKKGDHLAQIYSPELVSLQQELLEAAKAKKNLPADATDLVRNGVEKMYLAAQEKLRLLGFSEQESASLIERGTASDHMTIRAGQNGIVLKKIVEEGSYVKTGAPLFHIADLKKLWVILDAYESDLLWLRLGQKVDFSVEAYPGQIFTGSISFIDPVVKPETRTVRIRVIVDNNDGRLKPDMFVKAHAKASISKSGAVKNASLRGKWISPMHPEIIKNHPGTCDICGMPLVKAEELGYVTSGYEEVDPLVVPATAVLYTGERSIVYIEVPDSESPTFEPREVEIGPQVGSYYIIKSGISEGDLVVVNGSFKIDGELQIRAKPSMMSPKGGTAATGHAHHGDQSTTEQAGKPYTHSLIPDISKKETSATFLSSLGEITGTYCSIADGLAKDDFNGVKTQLIKLKGLVSQPTSYKGEQYAAWKASQKELRKILEHAHHTASLPDARSLFEKLSNHIITLEKHYGHSTGDNHYLAFCPMAFGNKGGYWLQKQETIQNPYFGAKMLKCGEIKETFKSK